MTDASRGFDPQQLWQAQPKAFAPITLAEIHRRAQSFRSHALRRRITSWAAAALGALALIWRLPKAGSWMIQLGVVLTLLGALSFLWRWQTINTVGPLPSEGQALVAAYRSNLVRLRDARRNIALWLFAPALPGLTLCFLGRWFQRHTPGLPVQLDHLLVGLIMALLGVLLAFSYVWNQREADRLQRKIDEL